MIIFESMNPPLHTAMPSLDRLYICDMEWHDMASLDMLYICVMEMLHKRYHDYFNCDARYASDFVLSESCVTHTTVTSVSPPGGYSHEPLYCMLQIFIWFSQQMYLIVIF